LDWFLAKSPTSSKKSSTLSKVVEFLAISIAGEIASAVALATDKRT